MAKGQNVEKVNGVAYWRRQYALRHLTRYPEDTIRFHLIRESGNMYDKNAVSALIAPIMDKGINLKAGLKSIVGGFCEGISYGLRLQVAI
jgi:hypothetical protein